MSNNTELTDLLSDLVRINNDRIIGYQHAVKDLSEEDSDLRPVFQEKIGESSAFVNHLESYIQSAGGTPPEGTTVSGKLFRVWMDFKATVTGNGRKAILDSCEFGEDDALEEYKDVLQSGTVLPEPILQTIGSQQSAIKKSHDAIKTLRDNAHN